MRKWFALCLVAAILLAGCGGVAPSAESGPPAEEYDARTTGELPGDVDASRVYERVQRLLDVPARANVTVRVADPPTATGDGSGGDSFLEYMGAEATSADGGPRGLAESGTDVTLYPTDDWSAALTESVLAHELVHALQSQHGVQARIGDGRAASMVERAVIEGAATYVQRAYADRYLNETPETVRPFNESAPYRKVNFAQYSLGARYFEARIDDPADVDRIYDDPPSTTEQLLHGDAPDEEPPRNLSVDVDAGEYVSERRTTRGELEVNGVLSTELGHERAWTAASGWGNDELVRFRLLPGPEEEGYAWVLRWDSAGETEEFRDAARTFLDRRGDRVDGRWVGPDHAYRLEPVGTETVVLVVGTEAFVDAVTVTGDDADVGVSIGDE